MTCPYGEIAGVTTGSRVIGSINLGRGFVSSTVGFPSSPHRLLYLSVRLTADHLYKPNRELGSVKFTTGFSFLTYFLYTVQQSMCRGLGS